jgi:hypothetical protein
MRKALKYEAEIYFAEVSYGLEEIGSDEGWRS